MITIEQAFERFLNDKNRPTGLTLASKKMYRAALGHFLRIISKHQIDELRADDLSQYCEVIDKSQMKHETIIRYIEIAQAFFAWLQRSRLINDLFGEWETDWTSPRMVNKSRALSDDKFNGLLIAVKSPRFSGRRDEAIILVMAALGLVADQVAILKLRDFNPLRKTLYTQNAMGLMCHRSVNDPRAIGALSRWMQVRPRSRFLFCQQDGAPLMAKSIRQMLRRVAEKNLIEFHSDGFYHRYIGRLAAIEENMLFKAG